MFILKNKMNVVNNGIRPIGDDINSLPTDEQYEQNPPDVEFLNSVFLPKYPEQPSGMSRELRAAIFAGMMYALLSSPMINKHLKKCSSNETVVTVLTISIIVGSTYLFNKFS